MLQFYFISNKVAYSWPCAYKILCDNAVIVKKSFYQDLSVVIFGTKISDRCECDVLFGPKISPRRFYAAIDPHASVHAAVTTAEY